MKRSPLLVFTVLLVVTAAVATAFGVALAQRDDHARTGPAMMHSGQSGPSEGRGGAMGPMMGSSDVDSEPAYLAEMVAHHREAVGAARELARSDRPRMRAFGESIVETQSAQIEQMDSWLDQWYPDASTPVEYRPMMRDLAGLSGDRLDRAFLQDMIGHHMAAVMMSQHLLRAGVADHDEVADLARSIRDEQHAEIIQMQRWLAAWFDADWRHGMGMQGGTHMGMHAGMQMGMRMRMPASTGSR